MHNLARFEPSVSFTYKRSFLIMVSQSEAMVIFLVLPIGIVEELKRWTRIEVAWASEEQGLVGSG
jgi:hypothetical protein